MKAKSQTRQSQSRHWFLLLLNTSDIKSVCWMINLLNDVALCRMSVQQLNMIETKTLPLPQPHPVQPAFSSLFHFLKVDNPIWKCATKTVNVQQTRCNTLIKMFVKCFFVSCPPNANLSASLEKNCTPAQDALQSPRVTLQWWCSTPPKIYLCTFINLAPLHFQQASWPASFSQQSSRRHTNPIS